MRTHSPAHTECGETPRLFSRVAAAPTHLVLEVDLNRHEEARVARLLHFVRWLLAYCGQQTKCVSAAPIVIS